MTRVQSQRTRQALLVVGTALEVAPAPEKLELFTEDGLPVDVGKDRTRARWRGTWSATPVSGPYETNDFVLDDNQLWILADADLLEEDATPPSDSVTGAWVLMTVSGGMRWMGEWDIAIDEYPEGAVVTWEDGLWVAPDIVVDNIEPGFVVDPDPPADLFVSRAVQFTEADRFNSEDDVLFEINAETGHDNDISSGLGAIIYIDKSGATSGAQLILTPIARVGDSDSFNASAYYPTSDFYRPFSSGTEDDTATDAHTPLVLPIEDGTEDLAYHIFFGAGQDGSFYARVSDNTNLVAPPVVEIPPVTWELMAGGGGGSAPPNILALYDAAQYNTTSNSYAYAGSEQIVVPDDGDYEVSMSAWLAVDNTSSGYECRAAVAVDGVIDNGLTLIKSALETPAYAVNSHSVAGRVLSLTAGDVIRPMYKAVGSFGTVYIEQIKIVLRPVTVV